jgi:phosphoribosyl-AMP cyclohydrolase
VSEFFERGTTEDIEQGSKLAPKFDRDGLIPAIAQDVDTGEVLMLAWMNADALSATLKTGDATYWSRSRRALWRKGETSGHTQRVVSVAIDCDQDALLLKVKQVGPACHTGAHSCFYRTSDAKGGLSRNPAED